MQLTSESVGLLAQRALCLEALADKEGCTTRYVDLEGRPLEDFIVAGINVGPAICAFASDWLNGHETRLFHRFKEALRTSNIHKSNKFVNFGLLEILFPTIAARLTCDNPSKVIDHMIDLMRQAPASDVAAMVSACELAWSTSGKRQQKLANITDESRRAASPYAFYEAVYKVAPADSASHQWIDNYRQELPLLRQQFDYMQQSDEPMLAKIASAYNPVRQANPDVRIGILADMSAAAIFLHLSYRGS